MGLLTYTRPLLVAGPHPVWVERINLIGYPHGVVVDPPTYLTPGRYTVCIDEENSTATIIPED